MSEAEWDKVRSFNSWKKNRPETLTHIPVLGRQLQRKHASFPESTANSEFEPRRWRVLDHILYCRGLSRWEQHGILCLESSRSVIKFFWRTSSFHWWLRQGSNSWNASLQPKDLRFESMQCSRVFSWLNGYELWLYFMRDFVEANLSTGCSFHRRAGESA